MKLVKINLKYVLFESAGKRFGFPVSRVFSVSRLSQITPLPSAKPFVKGLMNFRGMPIVVFDFLCLLGMKERRESTMVIVLGTNMPSLGILVGKILGLIDFRRKRVYSSIIPSDIAGTGFVERAVEYKGERLLLMAPERITQIKDVYAKPIINAPKGMEFHFHNGCTAGNLPELLNCIRNTESNVITQHLNNARNDFAPWISRVLKMPQLAQKVSKARTKKDIVTVLSNWLK